MRLILTGILIVLASIKAVGQELVFTVSDKDTKAPVELAYINVYTGNHILFQSVQTNEAGIAHLTIEKEKYPVTIETVSPGFEKAVKKFDAPPATASVDIDIVKKYTSLNEVVVTGLNKPERVKDALSTYKVIHKDAIDARGAITLDEAMRGQLNTTITNDDIIGNSINMQGMQGNKVKILIDGIPVNGRENGNINLGQLNMNNTERVEIIQGPMSVIYGSDALGGVVNVITKKETKPLGITAGWYGETINKYNFDGALTFGVKKRNQFTIGGARNFFEGWKNLDAYLTYHDDTLLSQRSQLYKPKEQYIGNFAYRYTAKSGFNLDLASDYIKEKVSNKGNLSIWDPFTGAYAFDEYYRTTRSMNRLSMSGNAGKKGHWQSQNGFSVYYRNRSRILKDMVTLKELPTNGQGDQDTSRFNDVYLRSSYSNNLNIVNYTAGYDINLESAHSLKISGYHKTLEDIAVYTTVNTPVIKDKLVVQAGIRAAYNSFYTPPVIPAFNVLYTPVKKLQVRASYALGFRAPSLKEQYLSFIDQNHHIIGNENLKAESSRHAQLSASYQLYEKGADYVQVMATGYYNDVTNEIVLAPVHPEDSTSIDYTYGNVARLRNTIGTVQLDGQKKDIYFELGYSHNYTFKQPGSYEAYSTNEISATLQYTWRATGLSFNVFYKHIGRQPFVLIDITGNAMLNGIQSPYNLCDASIGKKLLGKRFMITLGVKNLFNIETPNVTGMAVSTGPHGGGGSAGSFLPRSIFTSVRLNLD